MSVDTFFFFIDHVQCTSSSQSSPCHIRSGAENRKGIRAFPWRRHGDHVIIPPDHLFHRRVPIHVSVRSVQRKRNYITLQVIIPAGFKGSWCRISSTHLSSKIGWDQIRIESWHCFKRIRWWSTFLRCVIKRNSSLERWLQLEGDGADGAEKTQMNFGSRQLISI